MKFNSLKHTLVLVFSVFLLAGCETFSSNDEEAVDAAESQTATETDGAGETSGAPDEPQVSEEELAAQKAKEAAMKEQAALREVRTFYFDFDQSIIKAESRAPLAAHAAFLAANPNAKVVVEGHCDERGTREYNISLGESRAKAVERFLIVNGVSQSQIEIISYGEEKPVATGANEAAWAKNRRAYIEYK